MSIVEIDLTNTQFATRKTTELSTEPLYTSYSMCLKINMETRSFARFQLETETCPQREIDHTSRSVLFSVLLTAVLGIPLIPEVPSPTTQDRGREKNSGDEKNFDKLNIGMNV